LRTICPLVVVAGITTDDANGEGWWAAMAVRMTLWSGARERTTTARGSADQKLLQSNKSRCLDEPRNLARLDDE